MRTAAPRAAKPSGHVPPVRAVRLPSQAAGRLSSRTEGESSRLSVTTTQETCCFRFHRCICRLQCAECWLQSRVFLVDTFLICGALFPVSLRKLHYESLGSGRFFFLFLCMYYLLEVAVRKNFILFHYQEKMKALIN